MGRHSFAFAVLLLLMSLLPGIAIACTCVKEQDPSAILRGTDVILDGYVEKVEPADTEGNFIATIKVLRAWKGDPPDIVKLEYARYKTCVGYGMLKAQTTVQLYAYGDPQRGPLGVGFCDIAYSRPSPETVAAVEDYAARRQELRAAADGGSTRDKIRLAEFLLSYGDEPQALELLLPILRDEPDLFRRWITEEGGHEVLVWVRHGRKSKQSAVPGAPPSADGKVARAIFTLTGVADAAWKDWSNLEPIGGECRFETYPLESVSFAGSVLPACSFSKNAISNVDFTNAVLSKARFDGATLSNVTFDGAGLQGAWFDGAVFTGGNLREASAYGVSFKKAKLRDVEVSGQISGDFTGATLQSIKAVQVLGHFDLTSAILRDVEFVEGWVTLVTKDASLENLRFNQTRLSGLRAEDTDLSDVNFATARELTIYINCRTKLPASGIDPRGLIPVERACPGVEPRTDFRGVNWEYRDLRGLDFSGGDFTGASLRGVELSGTNLSNSNLSGIDFDHTRLSGATLDGANLDGATNLGWLAGSKKGINGGEDAVPASLRGTTFSGTTVSITDVVGIAGLTESIDLDAPNFDNATIRCLDRPLLHYLTSVHINDAITAAQEMREAEAIQRLRNKWPTAKFTGPCSTVH